MKKAPLSIALLCAASNSWSTESVELSAMRVQADFRQTDVQQLPEAVTVVDRAQIEARSAEHLEQILSLAPNVNFSSGSSRGRYYQIRGIGERSQFVDPVNPSVGLLIDGIDMTGLGAAATLFDVQQVEILRGPQGTRFGANALAGMINITSAAPTAEREGYVRGKLGNYHSYGLGGAFSGSLTESLQGRIAMQGFQSNGYVENDFLNRDDTQNIDEQLLRAKLAWQPDAITDIGLTYLYANINNGYDAFTFDNSRTSLADEPGNDKQETHALAFNLQRQLNNAVTLQTTLTGSRNRAVYSYDEDWAYGQYIWLDDDPIYQPDPCDISQGPCLADFDGYSSFDEYEREFDRYSLDVRLLSGPSGRIFANSTDWVAGIYRMQRDENLQRNYTYAANQYRSDLSVDSVSVYAELSTSLGMNTTLTYGARAEQWQNDFSDNNAIADKTDETLWGGKITLETLLALDHVGYASVARGYKAGGVNTDPDIDEANRTFDTEFNNTFELGIKSALLANTLRTRVAAFYIQRKDQQVKSSYAIQNPDNSLTFQDYLANAAEGRNYGLELESDWAVTDRLNWAFSYGWLRTEFVDYTYQTDDGEFDKNGRAQAHAPRYSVATALTYALTNALSLRIETEAKDEFYFSDSHDEKATSFVLWHARLRYQQPRYELALSGRNLTNQDIETRGFGGFGNDPRDGYADSRYVQLGDPRLLMLEGKYSF
ncbi:MAG: TonB-dependent receptor [Bacterioplanes sp.]|nr:TonB-dependent receptor [Bacterioplanes sp.]